MNILKKNPLHITLPFTFFLIMYFISVLIGLKVISDTVLALGLILILLEYKSAWLCRSGFLFVFISICINSYSTPKPRLHIVDLDPKMIVSFLDFELRVTLGIDHFIVFYIGVIGLIIFIFQKIIIFLIRSKVKLKFSRMHLVFLFASIFGNLLSMQLIKLDIIEYSHHKSCKDFSMFH